MYRVYTMSAPTLKFLFYVKKIKLKYKIVENWILRPKIDISNQLFYVLMDKTDFLYGYKSKFFLCRFMFIDWKICVIWICVNLNSRNLCLKYSIFSFLIFVCQFVIYKTCI